MVFYFLAWIGWSVGGGEKAVWDHKVRWVFFVRKILDLLLKRHGMDTWVSVHPQGTHGAQAHRVWNKTGPR